MCPHAVLSCPHCQTLGLDPASCTHGFPACPQCATSGPTPGRPTKCMFHARRTRNCATCAQIECAHLWIGPGCAACGDACMFHDRRDKSCPTCAFVVCSHGWTGPGCLMCGD